MKKLFMGTVLAVSVLASALAYAQGGFGFGSWWLDGDDAPQGAMGVGTGTCIGLGGTQTGLGLGLGFGDGTQPQPLDGTGFGSPLVR